MAPHLGMDLHSSMLAITQTRRIQTLSRGEKRESQLQMPFLAQEWDSTNLMPSFGNQNFPFNQFIILISYIVCEIFNCSFCLYREVNKAFSGFMHQCKYKMDGSLKIPLKTDTNYTQLEASSSVRSSVLLHTWNQHTQLRFCFLTFSRLIFFFRIEVCSSYFRFGKSSCRRLSEMVYRS